MLNNNFKINKCEYKFVTLENVSSSQQITYKIYINDCIEVAVYELLLEKLVRINIICPIYDYPPLFKV